MSLPGRLETRSKTLWPLFLIILLVIGGTALIRLYSRPKASVFAPTIPDKSSLLVHFIDVGQGDSTLFQFPDGQSMLVDAGDTDQGGNVIDYLKQQKTDRINLLVATHPHEDHIGGLPDVLAAFPVDRVWDSGYVHGSNLQRDFLRTIKEKGIRYENPWASYSQDIGQVHVQVLAPIRLISGTDSDANNNNLVVLVSYGKVSFLLTGDMEKEERDTVARWPQCTVLKVAHHGSWNGTDAAFLKQTKPKLAIITCGKDNSYGHPHEETISALSSAGIPKKITADEGTIVVKTDGKEFSVLAAGYSKKAAAPATPPVSVSGKYIGNIRSKAFHRLTCKSLPAERNRKLFNSRSEAIAQGYHPCGRCKP